MSTSERFTSTISIDRHAVIQKAVGELSQLGGALFTTCMAALFLYILLLHGPGWLSQLTSMPPLDPAVTNRILATTSDTIVANVNGMVAVPAAEGVLCGIVFWIAGVAAPAMWRAIGGLATLIPVVGGMTVWLPIAVTLAMRRAYATALIAGLGCLAAQSAVGHCCARKWSVRR